MTETLIARLERAAGPDRELDAEIHVASGKLAEEQNLWLANRRRLHDMRGPDPLDPTPEENAAASLRLCPRYTESLDAAIPGEDILYVEKLATGNYWVKAWGERGMVEAQHASEAIARRIAALRARAVLDSIGVKK